jgi:chaperonin cofactor prefoldin
MSNVYCEVCKCRPFRATCDWCKVQTCKGCTVLHACEAASMDMRQFAEEIKDMINAAGPPPAKEVEDRERPRREANMADIPLFVLDHMQQETKIIDDYYIKRSKELEERNNSLDGELKTLHNKFIELEGEYKNHISSIGHEIGAAYEAKQKEIINAYNEREQQFSLHIANLENQITELNERIQVLQAPKSAPTPQKKQSVRPKTTF